MWLPPSQFEAAFLSIAHGEEEIRATLAAAKEAMAAVAQIRPSAAKAAFVIEGCIRSIDGSCRRRSQQPKRRTCLSRCRSRNF